MRFANWIFVIGCTAALSVLLPGLWIAYTALRDGVAMDTSLIVIGLALAIFFVAEMARRIINSHEPREWY